MPPVPVVVISKKLNISGVLEPALERLVAIATANSASFPPELSPAIPIVVAFEDPGLTELSKVAL